MVCPMNDLDMNDNFDSGFERYRTYSLYFHRAFNGLLLQLIFTVIDEFFIYMYFIVSGVGHGSVSYTATLCTKNSDKPSGTKPL